MYICYEHSVYISHIRIMGMVHYEWDIFEPFELPLIRDINRILNSS